MKAIPYIPSASAAGFSGTAAAYGYTGAYPAYSWPYQANTVYGTGVQSSVVPGFSPSFKTVSGADSWQRHAGVTPALRSTISDAPGRPPAKPARMHAVSAAEEPLKLQPALTVNNDHQPISAAKKLVVSLAPALSLLGGVALLGASLGARLPLPISKSAWRTLKPGLEKGGTAAVSAALGFGALNDAIAGVTTQQPSMIAAGALQVIPAAMMVGAKSNATKAMAFNLWTLLAAVWTVGFANDMANKHHSKHQEPTRAYDMTTFKSVFDTQSQAPISQRLGTLAKEGAKMSAFIAGDHVHLAKSLLNGTSAPTSLKGLFEPSTAISRASVLLTYAGALPLLVKGLKNPNLLVHSRLANVCDGLKMGALALANLSYVNLALHRQDWKGRAPLLGVPLTVIGTSTAHNNRLIGMSQLGEGLNSLFFSDVALKGLPERQRLSETWLPDPGHSSSKGVYFA